MKKVTLFMILVVALTTATVFANSTNEVAENSVREEATAAASVKLINNTGGKVSIHTGTGFVSLNKGSSTSFSCKVGKKVSLANSGRKGKTLFTISSSMCGKTLKLADYM